MNPSSILYHEEFRPPRLLTWPLVFLGAGAVGLPTDTGLHKITPNLFYILAGACCVVLLLEFVAVTLEVTATEIEFRISPFYRQKNDCRRD